MAMDGATLASFFCNSVFMVFVFFVFVFLVARQPPRYPLPLLWWRGEGRTGSG